MLSEINHAMSDLSRAEKAVAEWILAHPRQTTDATIAAVADAAGTSQPTVVRFCRSMGVDGFRDFKLRLAAAMSRPESFVHKDVTANDSVEDTVGKVVDQSLRALVEMRARISTMPIKPAVAALGEARQIVFAGLGASGEVARDALQKFFRLGIPCASATDTPMLLQMAAIAHPRDVFIVISHTGRWPAVASAMQQARQREAAVIALTDPESPLAKAASFVLGARIEEDTNIYTPMSSRLAQLALLDALQVALAIRLGSDAEERLRLSKQVLLNA